MFIGWAYADHLDKSTEWMFAYMTDFAQVDYDQAVTFIVSTTEIERKEWYKKNPQWLEQMQEINKELLSNT